jgi:hypothetical protein
LVGVTLRTIEVPAAETEVTVAVNGVPSTVLVKVTFAPVSKPEPRRVTVLAPVPS